MQLLLVAVVNQKVHLEEIEACVKVILVQELQLHILFVLSMKVTYTQVVVPLDLSQEDEG